MRLSLLSQDYHCCHITIIAVKGLALLPLVYHLYLITTFAVFRLSLVSYDYHCCHKSIENIGFLKGLTTIYREGGYKTGGGGHVKLYPYKKGGGAEKVLG